MNDQLEDKILAELAELVADFPLSVIMESRYRRIRATDPGIDRILDRGDDFERSALKWLLTLGDAAIDEVVRFPFHLRMLLAPQYLDLPFLDTPDPHTSLASYKRLVWLRIMLRDRMGKCSIETTLSDLSELADRVVNFSTGMVKEETGFPVVWALGKWGARELNPASDIDAVLFTNDSPDPAMMDRKVRQWLSLLMPEEAPAIYPVDLRLRPEGENGPLVMTFRMAERYFFQRAANWERIAWLRGRQVVGKSPGWFREMLNAFLFQTTQTPEEIMVFISGTLEGIHQSAKPNDIKRMPGGIRDIEFFLHGLQLCYGGQIRKVQFGSILTLLDQMEESDILEQPSVTTLRWIYSFYRSLENILQTEEERAVFQLPSVDHPNFAMIAHIYELTIDKLQEKFSFARNEVRRILDKEFAEFQTGGSILVEQFDPQADFSLETNDHSQGPAIASTVRRIVGRNGTLTELIDEEMLSRLPDPGETISMLESAIHAYGGTKAWQTAFGGKPRMRSEITRVLSLAPRIAEEAIKRPYLWDRIGWRSLESCLAEDSIVDMKVLLGDFLFQAGILYINKLLDQDSFAAGYSKLIDRAVSQHLGRCAEIHGSGLAILAIGKWGGSDLLPGGDLDFLTVSGEMKPNESENLQRKVAGWRLAFEMESGLQMDDRLRPEGSGSPLVITLDRLEEYLATRADVWEKIAYARIRFIAGDRKTGQQAEELIRTFCAAPANEAEWAALHQARKRASGAQKKNRIDLKKAPGGLMDLDFFTVFAAWHHAITDRSWWIAQMSERLKILSRLDNDLPWQMVRESYRKLRHWTLVSFYASLTFHISALKQKSVSWRFETLSGISTDAIPNEFNRLTKILRDIYNFYSES